MLLSGTKTPVLWAAAFNVYTASASTKSEARIIQPFDARIADLANVQSGSWWMVDYTEITPVFLFPGYFRIEGDWPGIAGPRHFCTRIPRLMAVVKPWIQCLPARLLNNSQEACRGFEDLW
jgi:hypothetical protein